MYLLVFANAHKKKIRKRTEYRYSTSPGSILEYQFPRGTVCYPYYSLTKDTLPD